MSTDHHPHKPIRVSAHLEERRGYFHVMMNWVDRNGERDRKSRSTGLKVKGNKKRAEDCMRAFRREQESLLAQEPDTAELLFADFMEQWLDVIKKDVDKKLLKLITYGGYCLNVRSAIVPYFRKTGVLLTELTAEEINEFYDVQLERVKANTVIKFHSNINKALKYAVKKKLIQHSVMEQVDRPTPERFVGNFLRQSEVIALFDAVKGHKLELGVILGAYYGLRRSEIVGLRWESIDFEANTITIEHTVTVAHIDGKQVIIADDTTKSKASHRTLPLIPIFRAKLIEEKAIQDLNRKLCGKCYNKAEGKYIYTDAMGNRINPNYLTNNFPKFLEAHGFRVMRFHDLRHSCASLLLANKVPLKDIQEWLGHGDFSITANTYGHLDYESKLSSANAMSWIEKTTLAKGAKVVVEEQSTAAEPQAAVTMQELPDMLNELFASGVPVEIVQAWLKEPDLSQSNNLAVHFKGFARSHGVEYSAAHQ